MIESETNRKDRLLTLLENLEFTVKFQPAQKTLKFGFYDRIFNGLAKISKINKATLHLKRENGQNLGVLVVTPEIVEVSKVGDLLMATLGHRHEQWHLIQIKMIGSFLGSESNPGQMHLSVSKQAVMGRGE